MMENSRLHIHARSLIYFDTIRRCGSIREAARRLHVASSAVNRQLLQLEAEIGTPLFERMPSGLRLTPAGEAFSHHVITVLQDERRLENELELIRGVRRGTVKLMSVEGVNVDLLPTCLERMATRYPTIQISAHTAGSAQTAEAVINGDADVAIGFALPYKETLRQCAVGRFGLGAVVPPGHPLVRQGSVTFAECARYPLILPSPALSTHEVLRPVMAHHKRARTVLLETSSVELAKRLAARGVGVAFQTRIGLEQDLADERLAYLPLKAAIPLTAELGVYVRARRTLPPVLDMFIQIVAREIERRAAGDASRW